MDFGTILTGIIILAILFMPFVLMGINNKKKKNIIKTQLNNIAEQNNCKIKNYDIWKSSGIALDETEKYLIGYRKTETNEELLFFKLQEFSSCRIAKSTRTEDDNLVIENLKLILNSKNNVNKHETFEFYDVNTDSSQLEDEIEILNKWHDLVSNILK